MIFFLLSPHLYGIQEDLHAALHDFVTLATYFCITICEMQALLAVKTHRIHVWSVVKSHHLLLSHAVHFYLDLHELTFTFEYFINNKA